MQAKIEQLATAVRDTEDLLHFELTTRPTFGGAMVYANGKPVASIGGGGLGVKATTPDLRRRILAIDGAEPLRHRPDASASKSYIKVPRSEVDSDVLLSDLLNAANAALEER